ncbi:MAG: nucleotidyltransferase family protein [Acidobacteriota bacterium]|nr:nucleotidyltransferase family protein [Acidobacteriota bacterium]
MKAMILAAGLGTRLRPLTDNRPKALVEIAGRTMLEITLSRLRESGVSEVIVNIHHFADMVVDYLKAHDNFGMRIEVSREKLLLDTGGGLKKSAWFFQEDGELTEQPFVLHNVDVLSTVDLQRMVELHTRSGALATLAVQNRQTSRYLLFDEHLQLWGQRSAHGGESEIVRPSERPQALAFSGIHVISPRIFDLMTEDRAFSIVDCYLRLAAAGKKIVGCNVDGAYWTDLGTPENVARASDYLKGRVIS